jgi:outer membrane protein TolC
MKRAAAGLALCCAACAVDEAAEVDSYRALLDLSTDDAPQSPGGELDARTAMRLANARNEELAIEGEGDLRALIDRRRAASAFLPRVTLSPSYFARDGGVDGIDVPLSGSLDVSPVSDSANVRRSESEVERRRALLYVAQDALLVDVARTLFEVVRAERSGAVLENSLAVQQARVDDVRARRDVGFARPLDVSLSEAQAADTRVDLLEARRAAATGRAVLAFLIDAALDGVALDGALEVPEMLPNDDEWLARAVSGRQELAATRAGVDASAHDVRVATGGWWPSVSIDLDWFLSRDSAPTDEDWRGLIEIAVPIFEAGLVRANVRDALSRLREAKLEHSLALRGVERDIAVASENLTSSRERIERLRVRLVATREALDQANSLYDAGLATNLERLAAQQETLETELALESAELERRVFYLDLLRASGDLHEWAGLVRPQPDTTVDEPESARAEAR